MTLFSVITVTKANPHGFARTKASVQAQSFHGYEWIVVDGDVTPDAGIYDAMNKGLDRAQGDYVLFVNAGDMFAGVDTLLTLANLAGLDFLYGDALEDGHLKPARHDIAQGMITHHQAMMYRRAVIGALRYDTQYSIAADYKFTAQFLALAKSRHYIPLPLCVFETGGISQTKAALGRREESAIRAALGLHAPFAGLRQIAAHMLRRYLPALYWGLRTRFRTSRA